MFRKAASPLNQQQSQPLSVTTVPGLTRSELKVELQEQLEELRKQILGELRQEVKAAAAKAPVYNPRAAPVDSNLIAGLEELSEITKRGFRPGLATHVHQDLVAGRSRSAASREDAWPLNKHRNGNPYAVTKDASENSADEADVTAPLVASRSDTRIVCCAREIDVDPDLLNEPGMTNWRLVLRTIVDSDPFAYFVTSLVILNAILIGIETDYTARNADLVGSDALPGGHSISQLFCWVFTMEVSCRVFAFGGVEFFFGSDWKWNWFDFLVVSLQWFEDLAKLLFGGTGGMNLGFLRILRTLRIIRIMRLARVLHLVVELRTMVASITASLKPLLWAMLLFSMLIYAVAVALTQTVNELRQGGRKHDEELDKYFGNLGIAVLSLWECISGGIDWQDMAGPLIRNVSPLMGLFFAIYVAFSVLAMMNVITGIFVDNATTYAQQDKDMYVVKHVINLFKQGDLTSQGDITWKVFQQKLATRELKELFQAVDVDQADAESLFKLIDVDESGTVTPEELIRGWIRLRGPAKALDLSLLIREMTRSTELHRGTSEAMAKSLDYQCKAVEVLLRQQGSAISGTAPSILKGGALQKRRHSITGFDPYAMTNEIENTQNVAK